jgi:hypothetical protein
MRLIGDPHVLQAAVELPNHLVPGSIYEVSDGQALHLCSQQINVLDLGERGLGDEGTATREAND